MKIEVISIFPGMFEQLFSSGVVGRAIEKNLLEIHALDLRDFTDDRHRTVDDRPYGGGEGMVLRPEPLFRAVDFCKAQDETPPHTILLSPQGSRFDQAKAKELSLRTRLILICGRYEGVDQRVADHLIEEEISIGDFVLSGGELAAAVVVDAVSRLVPGVVGRSESVLEESFMDGLLDYPHYTRPADFRGLKIPEVLLTGDHTKIRDWRRGQALLRTRRNRPDLLRSVTGSSEENENESG